MKAISTPLITVLSTAIFALTLATGAIAESTPTQDMARIVMDLNHYPSDNDKQRLRSIVENGTEAERVIAEALINMRHSISSPDREKLRMVQKDRSISEQTRTLAEIVERLNHHASAMDRETLSQM